MEHFYQNIQGWFTFPNFYSTIAEKFQPEVQDRYHIVEVGSWLGKSACYMAVELINNGNSDNVIFDCVDTWEGSIEHINEDGLIEFDWVEVDRYGNIEKEEHYVITSDELYEKFLEIIEPVRHIINPIRMKSVDAAKLYDDGSLDLVFIDAGHTFEDVVADIEAWLPKVRPYGFIAGHDYSWDDEVKRAVHSKFPTISMETEGCWVKINDGK
mgnify:FL=1|tara:strand:+ start:99 stop:734 length:636 start_codon:yes stop_codon:yes gene_type:complete